MLIAGLHYAWNAGQLQSFEPTFLFHKIQTMSDVNKFLHKSDKKYAVCVRNISTLCFSEVIGLHSLFFLRRTSVDGFSVHLEISWQPKHIWMV